MAAAQAAGYNGRLRMRPPSIIGSLRNRNLAAYLGSRFCSGTAMTMLRAAIAWHVFALTNSAFHLGLIGLVQFLPGLSLTLLGGAVADTFERRRIIMLAQLVPLSCALALFVGHAQRLRQRAAALCHGVRHRLLRPRSRTRRARRCCRRWCRASIFPRAVTLASTGQALAFMSGPAGGGFVIAEFGIARVYAALRLLIVGLAARPRDAAPGAADAASGAMSWSAVREGLALRAPQPGRARLHDARHVRRDLRRRGRAAADLRQRHPRRSVANGYGVLSASLEAGALLTSLGLVLLPPVQPRRARPARRGGGVRARHHRIRPVALVSALDRVLHARRRRRSDQRGDAQHRHPALRRPTRCAAASAR